MACWHFTWWHQMACCTPLCHLCRWEFTKSVGISTHCWGSLLRYHDFTMCEMSGLHVVPGGPHTFQILQELRDATNHRGDGYWVYDFPWVTDGDWISMDIYGYLLGFSTKMCKWGGALLVTSLPIILCGTGIRKAPEAMNSVCFNSPCSLMKQLYIIIYIYGVGKTGINHPQMVAQIVGLWHWVYHIIYHIAAYISHLNLIFKSH